MANPIMLKEAHLEELPIKGFYRDVGYRLLVDEETSRTRQARGIEIQGEAGVYWYVQAPKRGFRWELLTWTETFDGGQAAPIPLVVRKEPVMPTHAPAVERKSPVIPSKVVLGTKMIALPKADAPTQSTSHKPGDIVKAGKSTFRIGAKGEWISVEAPAPVSF